MAAGKDRHHENVAQSGSAVETKEGPSIDHAHGTTTQQVAGSNPAILTSPQQEARGERAPPFTAIFIQSTVKNECDSAEETADGSEKTSMCAHAGDAQRQCRIEKEGGASVAVLQ